MQMISKMLPAVLLLMVLNLSWSTDANDLLDLYVQHMDEIMRGSAAPELSIRARRSVIESQYYRASDVVRQDLEERQVRRENRKKPPQSRPWESDRPDDGTDLGTLAKQRLYSPRFASRAAFLRLASRGRRARYLAKKQRRHRTSKRHHSRGRRKKSVDEDSEKLVARQRRHTALVGDDSNNNHTSNDTSSDKDQVVLKEEPPRQPRPREVVFTRLEHLDEDGEVMLEWDTRDEEIGTFRITAKTLGYVSIGFTHKRHATGADILVAWVDDNTRSVNLLDLHSSEHSNSIPEVDASQDIHVIRGFQNNTHTSVTFTRKWDTCDPQDYVITADTVQILWSIYPNDPEFGTPTFINGKSGTKWLRLRAVAAHPYIDEPDIVKWEVKLNQFAVSNTSDTIYWCKIFKAPHDKLMTKHHLIGFTPLVHKDSEALVHHIILYECASSQSILGEHARLAGAHCYSPTMPKEWDTCLQPVVLWVRGSVGEWMPQDVGLPIAENPYYMLEVHYNNFDDNEVKRTRDVVYDSSGLVLHLTPKIRPNEAGYLVTGIAVSPLHMIPPSQEEYATAGYCCKNCTEKMLPEDGINIVSVTLHAHMAGRRMGMKHIRNGTELPRIAQDNKFDFNYQQSYTVEKGVKVLPGDELVTECVYNTRHRNKPTFGGYAATQEMCLGFVLHYPKIPLAACYSMTPVSDFFDALNVRSFKGMTMDKVEKLFLTSAPEAASTPISPLYPDFQPNEDLEIDIIREAKSAVISSGNYMDYNEIFARLVIETPDEFKGHTLTDHMMALAWNDSALSDSFEKSIYHEKHVTFCRERDNKLPLTSEISTFPNFTALPIKNSTHCINIQESYKSTSHSISASWILMLSVALVTALPKWKTF